MFGAYNRRLAVLRAASLVGFLVVVSLSGCIGGKSGQKGGVGPSATGQVLSTGGGQLPFAGNNSTAEGGISDPKRHFHHYWGGEGYGEELASVTLFKGELALRPSEENPDPNAFFLAQRYGCSSLAYVEFSPESDEDDVAADSSLPWKIDGPIVKADTVFAGASHIRVTVDSIDQILPQVPNEIVSTQPSLYFHYKPANVNYFLPENSGCGVKLDTTEAYNVTVGPKQADPPHNFHTSRWRFLIFAALESSGQGTIPAPAPIKFRLTMEVYKGSEKNLDPAHPDLYKGGPTYELGCTEAKDIARQVVVFGEPAAPMPPRDELIDARFPFGKIVPLLTEKVTVTLDYTYAGSVAGTTLELWYYGADRNTYEKAPDPQKAGTTYTYEIRTTDDKGTDLKADPPYETNSLWRFMLVPRPPDPVPKALPGQTYVQSVADFEGDYKICGTAHRIPGKILD